MTVRMKLLQMPLQQAADQRDRYYFGHAGMAAGYVVLRDATGDVWLPQSRIEVVTRAVCSDEHQQIAMEHAGAEVGRQSRTMLTVAQHAGCLVGAERAQHMADLSGCCQDSRDVDWLALQILWFK